jgi:hypothetical protein
MTSLGWHDLASGGSHAIPLKSQAPALAQTKKRANKKIPPPANFFFEFCQTIAML